MNKDNYILSMEEIFSDSSTYLSIEKDLIKNFKIYASYSSDGNTKIILMNPHIEG